MIKGHYGKKCNIYINKYTKYKKIENIEFLKACSTGHEDLEGFCKKKALWLLIFKKCPLGNLQRGQRIKGSKKTCRKENLHVFV